MEVLAELLDSVRSLIEQCPVGMLFSVLPHYSCLRVQSSVASSIHLAILMLERLSILGPRPA